MLLIVAFILTSSLSWAIGFPGGQGSSGRELVANRSGVTVTEVLVSDGLPVLFECQGLQLYTEQLDDVGLTSELAKSVTCVVADLDGNGEMDIAVWGQTIERSGSLQSGAVPTRKFKVLFFEDGKVHKEQLIINPGRDHIWLYPPRKESDEFGSPVSKLPGLVQTGEGGPTFYYIFDATSGLLRKTETLSEWR